MNNLVKQEGGQGNLATNTLKANNNLAFDKAGQGEGKSFGDELNAMVKQMTANMEVPEGMTRDDLEAMTKNFLQQKMKGNQTKMPQQNLAAMSAEVATQEAEVQKSLVRQEDARAETHARIITEEAQEDAHIQAARYESSEGEIADSSEANAKYIAEEAAQEGNVGQQQAEHDDDDAADRQTQLANWDNLAPMITEDAKNLAVKLDIPGVKDLETIIVRMIQGKVNIQALGDKKTMKVLEAYKGELIQRLSAQGISLGDFKAYDISLLKNHQKKQARAAVQQAQAGEANA